MDEGQRESNNGSNQGSSEVRKREFFNGVDRADVVKRLNIGCGNKKLDGYINCDFHDNYSGILPDVICDIRELPFPDGFADEVLAVHVLEHFYIWEAEAVVKEWMRVLKPGGKLIIEVPCLDKIIQIFVDFQRHPPTNLSMWGLYGDPGYKDERMCHHWCYSVNDLHRLLTESGMKDIELSDAKFHVPMRDMRMEATKC